MTYVRNTPGGRPVNTGPPRTNTGLTGLGAVGGKTGVGAGALRVIVEFLTQYDAAELEKLEQDINKLQKTESRNNRILDAEAKVRSREQAQLTRVQNLQERAKINFTRAQLKEIKDIRDLERSRARGAVSEARQRKAALAQQTGFTKSQVTSLVNEDKLRQKIDDRREKSAGRVAAAEGRIKAAQQAQVPIQQKLTTMQNIRANVVPKLGALALGAVGGVFGGAIVGLGFAAAQALIETIGTAVTALFDPAKKAREELKGIADEIGKIADEKNISALAAAKELLQELGQGQLDPSVLALATVIADIADETERLKAINEVYENSQRLVNDALVEYARVLAQVNNLETDTGKAGVDLELERAIRDRDPSNLNAERLEIYNQVIGRLEDGAKDAANAVDLLAMAERGAATAANIAAAGTDRLVSALQRASGLRITGLQDQLESLGGPSARTQQLQGQLEGIATAQRDAAYASQLQQIQEQRALVLLEQRIRFQGQSVQLDQLSARAQMVAIDARIEALGRAGIAQRSQLDALNESIKAARRADQEQDKRDQEALEVFDEKIEAIKKQGDAQEDLNRLLDLQYKLGQKIKRSQGESIADFIQRRANEERGLLAERDELARQAQIAGITAERDELAAVQELANEKREAAIEAQELQAEQLQAQIQRIEQARQAEIQALNDRKAQLALEVQLQELAEQEKQLAAQETARQNEENLRNALEESQRRDEEELKSRRESLEAQIRAEEDRFDRVKKWSDSTEQERLRSMILGARTQSDIAAIIGEVTGARRAYAEIGAYLKSINADPILAAQILGPLKEILDLANSRLSAIQISQPRPGPTPMAHGGVFKLTNAMNNPFGANIRTGESGQEIGVVLSNRVARILQEQQGSRLPPMNLTINRSRDPWRDTQRAKTMVRDTIREVLG